MAEPAREERTQRDSSNTFTTRQRISFGNTRGGGARLPRDMAPSPEYLRNMNVPGETDVAKQLRMASRFFDRFGNPCSRPLVPEPRKNRKPDNSDEEQKRTSSAAEEKQPPTHFQDFIPAGTSQQWKNAEIEKRKGDGVTVNENSTHTMQDRRANGKFVKAEKDMEAGGFQNKKNLREKRTSLSNTEKVTSSKDNKNERRSHNNHVGEEENQVKSDNKYFDAGANDMENERRHSHPAHYRGQRNQYYNNNNYRNYNRNYRNSSRGGYRGYQNHPHHVNHPHQASEANQPHQSQQTHRPQSPRPQQPQQPKSENQPHLPISSVQKDESQDDKKQPLPSKESRTDYRKKIAVPFVKTEISPSGTEVPHS